MKKIILFTYIFTLNQVAAESAQYNSTNNTLTIPIVQLNNQNFSNVMMSCDPNNGYSCKLTGVTRSDCANGIYEGNIGNDSDNTYSIHTRSSNGIEHGGIQLNDNDGQEFAASWVKSPKNKNPYLIGQDLSQFSDNQAYGIIGGSHTSAYPGFEVGDLITVSGDSTGYFIAQINGNATATFNKGNIVNVNNSCHSTTGIYWGDIDFSSKNFYSINILNNKEGSIQLDNPNGNEFTASWDRNEKILDTYSIAIISEISPGPYEKFAANDQAFVTDIGNGIAITAIDSNTGTVKSTAVFIKQK
jgi:hypothetical protein